MDWWRALEEMKGFADESSEQIRDLKADIVAAAKLKEGEETRKS